MTEDTKTVLDMDDFIDLGEVSELTEGDGSSPGEGPVNRSLIA